VPNDGLIRLLPDALDSLDLVHLISGLDEDAPASASAAVATTISGYTEWITHSAPAVTLGWDWQMLGASSRVLLRRVGEPRSNLMIVDDEGDDLGHERSSAVLEQWIDIFRWQDSALSCLDQRYAIGRATGQAA
jgi:hypothetical protein